MHFVCIDIALRLSSCTTSCGNGLYSGGGLIGIVNNLLFPSCVPFSDCVCYLCYLK